MNKILKILLTEIIFLIIFTGIVLAEEGHSMEAAISTNKKSYDIGEEILVDISINEIKGFSGLNTFLAKKVYDSEKVEYIGAQVTNSNWEILGDAENILLRKIEGEDLNKGKICTLKFKALKEGKTKIQIDKLDACNDEGYVYYEDGNVNSPFIEIIIQDRGINNIKENKTYIGIILIAVGTLGIIAVGIHYKLNKN